MCECSKVFPLDPAVLSFCFLLGLMENNNKIRELYEIYLELGHDVFEEKIKKPMENYLHDGSNVITINSL